MKLQALGAAVLALAIHSAPMAAERSEVAHKQWRTETARFATCLAERETEGSQEFLSLNPDAADYQRDLRAFIRSNAYCSNEVNLVSIDPVLLSGALAEALLKQKNIAPGSPELVAVSEGDQASAMGLCVARTSPSLTGSLLRSPVVGRGEYEAALALESTIMGCKKQKGGQITPAELRALTALGAYRLVAMGELDIDALDAVGA